MGLSTDTGSFRYRQTTVRTFEAATGLVRAGANPAELAQHAYQSYGPSRLYLLREALNRLQLGCQGRVAYFFLNPEVYAVSGAKSEETEGLLEQLQAVRNFEVVMLFEDMGSGATRVSLRSRGQIDVQKIAGFFGGGGHQLAAGIRSRLCLPELEKALLAAIALALPKETAPGLITHGN